MFSIDLITIYRYYIKCHPTQYPNDFFYLNGSVLFSIYQLELRYHYKSEQQINHVFSKMLSIFKAYLSMHDCGCGYSKLATVTTACCLIYTIWTPKEFVFLLFKKALVSCMV